MLKPLREGGQIARRERDKRARELLERYVGMLELQCQRSPFEWFNFFRFWQDEPPNAARAEECA